MNKASKAVASILIVVGLILIGIGVVKEITVPPKENPPKEKYKTPTTNYFEINEITNKYDAQLGKYYPITDINNLSDNIKTKFILDNLNTLEGKSISYNKVKEESKKYFQNMNIVKTDIKDDQGNILYKYRNNNYTFTTPEIKNSTTVSKSISDEKQKEEWIIKRKIYYQISEMVDSTYQIKIYKSPADITNNTPLQTFINQTESITPEQYTSIENFLYTSVYTYKVGKGNYYLESIKFE